MVKKKIIVPKIYKKSDENIEVLIVYDFKEFPILDPKKIGITLYGFNFEVNPNITDEYLFYKKNNITIYLQRSNNITKDKIYLKDSTLKSKIKYKDIFELSIKSLIKIDQSLNR